MNEKTIELNIPVLMPEVTNDQDECLVLLEKDLNQQRGIQRAHLMRDQTPAGLCLHYDPVEISVDEVRTLASRAASKISQRFQHKNLSVSGMDCSDCALVIEHGLERMPGVLHVNVDYAGERIAVGFDARHVSQRAIKKRVRQLGYDVSETGLRRWFGDYRELLFSALGGLFLVLGWAGQRFLGLAPELGLSFYLLAYVLSGYDITRHALHSLRERRFDTDLLMLMAALGAASLGDFAEGALLLFLFSLGHALEERVVDRARNAIQELAELAPKTALVRRHQQEQLVPVDRLQIGETVILRPGVRVPVDGEVLSGASAVDQSPVTGESIPVEKTTGEKVYAGSVNGEGVLEVKVTRMAKDSTLARVMKMVQQAQEQKSPTQQLTDRFTRVFIPAILGIDLLVMLVPLAFGVPFATSFLRAMTLLVAASPCALALGPPAAVLAGIAQAARSGILIKGGVHLENLGRLQAIAFDKTGTLTQGAPQVEQIFTLNGMPENRVLELAASVEARSAHPLAQAVLREARQRQIQIQPVEEVLSITGLGIQARLDGSHVQIGSLKLFDEDGRVTEDTRRLVNSLESQGKSVLLVGLDRQLEGMITVADAVRPNAASALDALRNLGVEQIVMLSGDNPRAAQQIARQVGVQDFRAGLLPDEKVDTVRELVSRHHTVAMVGDGVNDAPALANATVGIAMGGAATDVALETADVALMASDLSKLPLAIGLGRAARRVIQQNLIIALGVILILAILAVTGLTGIGWAVVVHEGSTLVVALNALRLLGYREK
jgi:Cd2+/Zn2+-exporting ATPase